MSTQFLILVVMLDLYLASVATRGSPVLCRGKAPPIDPFAGDDKSPRFEEWLPSLERAADWNAWTDEQKLLQLAGNLRGRAVQEWSLIPAEDRTTFSDTVKSLRVRVDPEDRVLPGQDFRHARQEASEFVADYFRCLERLFQTAYGRDARPGKHSYTVSSTRG